MSDLGQLRRLINQIGPKYISNRRKPDIVSEGYRLRMADLIN